MIPVFKIRMNAPRIFGRNDILITSSNDRGYTVLHSYKEKANSYEVLLTPVVRKKGWLAAFIYRINFFFIDNYLSFVYDY
jgi:hypothetical protein